MRHRSLTFGPNCALLIAFSLAAAVIALYARTARFDFVYFDDDQYVYVNPHIARGLPGEFSMATVYTAINRQGVVFLWPVKLPATDGRVIEWHRAALTGRKLTRP